MTAMIQQCYFCKLHEQGIKCAKYDQIAHEILVNLMKCTFIEDTDPEGLTMTIIESIAKYGFIVFIGSALTVGG